MESISALESILYQNCVTLSKRLEMTENQVGEMIVNSVTERSDPHTFMVESVNKSIKLLKYGNKT